MIITSIKAENVLKYQSLNIQSLPESGVIAISGKNESGKSTIGETVCFALFGRTFSLGADELDKLVYWGSGGCSVSLTFRVEDNHYSIERFLDKDGNHSAKFSRLGEEDLPIARGVEGVSDALFMVLGYDYEEFVDSFYLAQREITAPQPNSHTVKAMAGIAALEFVNEQFDEEIAELDDINTMSRFRSDEIDAELTELAIKDGHLKALEDELELVKAAESENTDKIDQLRLDTTNYRETFPDIQAVRSSIGRSSGLRYLLLFSALVFGGLWAALTQFPEAGISQQLQEIITRELPAWNEQHLEGLMYLAGGLGVFFIIIQLRLFSLKSKFTDLMQVAQQMGESLKSSHERTVVLGDSILNHVNKVPETPEEEFSEVMEQLESGAVESTVAKADALMAKPATDNADLELESVRPTDGEINTVCERAIEASIKSAEVEEVVEREMAWTKEENQRLQVQATKLDRAIYDEQQRLKHAGHLNDERESLMERIQEATAKISVRTLANELLEGANEHLSTQFNNDVRDLVSRTLPLFTEGRYEHLQIDRNMVVSVFSGEKRDFLDLEEVSSGTQRQIMLALRLALSQELANRSVEGEQFLFLDEPFAFFDEARTKSSLKVLPDLSQEINQIFVVGQDFPEENMPDFALHIECFREIETISLV